jgi:hypothetical protein
MTRGSGLNKPISRPNCVDGIPMTPRRILAILKHKHVFDVTNAPHGKMLREACEQMVAKGDLFRFEPAQSRRFRDRSCYGVVIKASGPCKAACGAFPMCGCNVETL